LCVLWADRNVCYRSRKSTIMLELALLIVLILLLVGSLPRWPYSSGWGYYPSGGVGLIVVILVVMWLLGMI
jgi:Protein of unknown function (DUF3309)